MIKETYLEKEYKLKNKVNLKKDFAISVLIPVHNGEKYLAKCLDSLVKQTICVAFEVVVVNDGSTDSTLQILKDYQNKLKNLKIISQENKGIANARNTLLENADGEYLAFVDADDFVSNDYLEKLYQTAIKNEADFVKCGYHLITENNKIKDFPIKKICLKNGLQDYIFQVKGYLWAALIKKTLFTGICFPENYFFEDMITRMFILKKVKIFVAMDDLLYHYVKHENSATKRQGKKSNIHNLDQFYLVEKILENAECIDEVLLKLAFCELNSVLYVRTRHMPKKIRRQIFDKTVNLLKKYDFEKVKFTKLDTISYFWMKNKLFYLWRLTNFCAIILKKLARKEF